MSQVKLDGPTIYKKVQKIQNAWNQVSSDFGQKLQIWRKNLILRVSHVPHCIPKDWILTQFKYFRLIKIRRQMPYWSCWAKSKKMSPWDNKPKTFCKLSVLKLNFTWNFSVWLLGYEFSDTLVVLTKEKIVFAVYQKKSKYYIWTI